MNFLFGSSSATKFVDQAVPGNTKFNRSSISFSARRRLSGCVQYTLGNSSTISGNRVRLGDTGTRTPDGIWNVWPFMTRATPAFTCQIRRLSGEQSLKPFGALLRATLPWSYITFPPPLCFPPPSLVLIANSGEGIIVRCDATLRDTPASSSNFLQTARLAGFYQVACTMSSDLQSTIVGLVLSDYLSRTWSEFCAEKYLIQSHSRRVYNCGI